MVLFCIALFPPNKTIIGYWIFSQDSIVHSMWSYLSEMIKADMDKTTSGNLHKTQ